MAISYDSLNFLCHKFRVDLAIDIKDIEEKESESDKTEKTEKSSFLDELNLLNHQNQLAENGTIHVQHYHINFSSADYSLVIYSPPEFA